MFKQSNFYKKYKDHGGIEITSAEKHIYSFLWYAYFNIYLYLNKII